MKKSKKKKSNKKGFIKGSNIIRFNDGSTITFNKGVNIKTAIRGFDAKFLTIL